MYGIFLGIENSQAYGMENGLAAKWLMLFVVHTLK